jgi:hypothetical protein
LTVPPGTVYWVDCYEAGCPYRGPVRDDAVAALGAFEEAHRAAHPDKNFKTIGWPDSVAWILMGSTPEKRRESRQGSLGLEPLCLDYEADVDESCEADPTEEPAEAPVKAPVQVGLFAFGGWL